MHVLLKSGFLLLLLSVLGLSGCGTSNAQYEVEAVAGENGSVAKSKIMVKDGDDARFNIMPNDGYIVGEITIRSKSDSNSEFSLEACSSSTRGQYNNSRTIYYYTLKFVYRHCLINVSFIEAGRVLSLQPETIFEKNSGTTNMDFSVSLAEAAFSDISVDYATTDGTATAGVDYIANSGRLDFAPGETSKIISVVINGDGVMEGNETFTLALDNVTGRGALGLNKSVTGLILNDDFDVTPITLNDTGMTYGGNYPNGDNAGCTGETIAQQDCSSGRDATLNDNTDGHAGFSYRKVDNFGTLLAASAANWSCVKDQVTGLIWEVKQSVASGLHDKSDSFTWYSTNSSTNGGDVGRVSTVVGDCYGYNSALPDATACNTQAFVARVNAEGLCGKNNWRMPSRMELLGLVDLNRPQGIAYSASIDEDYFPNTINDDYWSSSRMVLPSGIGAAYINFSVGISWSSRIASNYVRLVSDGPLPIGGGTDL